MVTESIDDIILPKQNFEDLHLVQMYNLDNDYGLGRDNTSHSTDYSHAEVCEQCFG